MPHNMTTEFQKNTHPALPHPSNYARFLDRQLGNTPADNRARDRRSIIRSVLLCAVGIAISVGSIIAYVLSTP